MRWANFPNLSRLFLRSLSVGDLISDGQSAVSKGLKTPHAPRTALTAQSRCRCPSTPCSLKPRNPPPSANDAAVGEALETRETPIVGKFGCYEETTGE